jgi:hypothetical protein
MVAVCSWLESSRYRFGSAIQAKKNPAGKAGLILVLAAQGETSLHEIEIHCVTLSVARYAGKPLLR